MKTSPSMEILQLLGYIGVLDQEDVLPVTAELRKLADDKEIGGVVLWIDSPGGGVSAVTEIYDEVQRLNMRILLLLMWGALQLQGVITWPLPATK